MALQVSIDAAVARRFPEILVGSFRTAGLGRLALSAAESERLFAAARAGLAAGGVTLERLTAEPRIAAWRSAVETCGLKPSTYRSSAEQLARRVLKGQGIGTPIAAVNLYCAVSVKHLAPLGAYDLARLPGRHLELRLGRPGRDRFSPLGARPEDMPISEDVVVYASGDEVLCWAFNHRDSRVSCLAPATDQAIFMGEAVAAVQQAALREALAELAALLDAAGVEVERPEFIAAA